VGRAEQALKKSSNSGIGSISLVSG
jgi:hypothetical protein